MRFQSRCRERPPRRSENGEFERMPGSRNATEGVPYRTQTMELPEAPVYAGGLLGSRAYALRSLAQRFPAGTDLTAADRQVLEALAREHTRVLISQINELHRTLAPVLVSLGGSPAQGRTATSYDTWQSAAEGVLRSGRRMELLISTLLGVTPEPSNAHVPSELLAAFADLRSALDACQSLL